MSNVEGLPVAQNIQEMCEAQKLEDDMEMFIEEVAIEDELQTASG